MEIPDHLTCLLRNLSLGQEVTVRTGHGTTDCFQIGKGVCQGCILSPCLFNLYAEYIMRNAGQEEAQLESRLPGEISVTSDMQMTPPLWAESEEELKSLLMKVKEESEEAGLKFNTQKAKIMAVGLITSRHIVGEAVETVSDFIFLGSKITADICVSILYWCFSFWLTSLCIIGSSFIHLIRTDSNEFFLMAE